MVPTQVLHDSEQNILNWHKRGVGVTVVVVCRFVKECRPVQGLAHHLRGKAGTVNNIKASNTVTAQSGPSSVYTKTSDTDQCTNRLITACGLNTGSLWKPHSQSGHVPLDVSLLTSVYFASKDPEILVIVFKAFWRSFKGFRWTLTAPCTWPFSEAFVS